jgi:creatinine amidohydrolase
VSGSGQSVQLELLLPSEIRATLARRPVVYIPLGTYEWHGEHLPIGLDALTAHGISIQAALRDGGLVCPPLYYGTGGGHGAYPWTIMVSEADIAPLLHRTLVQLRDFGVDIAVLMSGHFAGEQIGMIEAIAARWQGRMSVRALAVNMAPLAIAPDHAALFETTLLSALWPDRVRIDLLPPLEAAPSLDPDGDQMGPQRHDPTHPLFGILGPDPRRYDPAHAPALLDAMVDWVIGEVRKEAGNGDPEDHALYTAR